MIVQTINLNLIPGGVLPRINVSQYDKGSRTLLFNLYNGNVAYTIPVDATVNIQGTKADKTGFQYACTFSGSVVTADLEQQMTAFPGEVTTELVITLDGDILGTANFIINVEAAALADDTVISDTELPLIQQAVEAVAETEINATRAEDAAEDAEESAEDAEAWAVGKRNGADVPATDPAYHNNAKYWADYGVHSFNGRSGSVLPIAGDYNADIVAYNANMSVKQKIDSLVTGVSSFNGRSGSVLPVAGDYTADTVPYDANTSVKQKIDSIVGGGGVTSFNGRSGSVLPIAGDYTADTVMYDANTTTKAKIDSKQNTLVFDNAPTSASSNPVKSGGVYTALSGKLSGKLFGTTTTANGTTVSFSGIDTTKGYILMADYAVGYNGPLVVKSNTQIVGTTVTYTVTNATVNQTFALYELG